MSTVPHRCRRENGPRADIAELASLDRRTQVLLSAESTATRAIAYPNRFRVWIRGQVRRVTKVIRREMRRRAPSSP